MFSVRLVKSSNSLFLVISVFILIINLYAISLFIRNPVLRKKAKLFLLSLSIADLLLGIMALSFEIIRAEEREISYFLYLFLIHQLPTVSGVSSILSICAITADRYLSICYPIRHRVLVRTRFIRMLLCATWIIAAAYTLIPLLWMYKIYQPPFPTLGAENISKYMDRYSIANAALFSIPVCGLSIAFVRMYYVIRNLRRNEQQYSTNVNQEERRHKRERKAIVIFSLMFAAYVLCWGPWTIILADTDIHNQVIQNQSLIEAITILRFVTAIINPLLYTFHEREFQRAVISDKNTILSFFCGIIQRRNREEVPEGGGGFVLRPIRGTDGNINESNEEN